MSVYNATIREIEPDGTIFSTFVGEINDDGLITRSNAAQFTGYEGTRYYDYYLRARAALRGNYLEATIDDCEGYKAVLAGLTLPPAYRVGR